ncbi:hypothetical protein SAMN04487859_1473 [Roseovarius lutimaris]|uniref:Uncharacterized protein n=1 Tax=Roseovarius lutimaris TaxID=1005928 RepID=A0A1I5H0X5_9RHOB|nr:hypothetical protein [Roseovarius lutimaris]SFO41676.1 hypothetical protein SAMN04487859_1473 [Roseovarius lutimaris]
MLLVNIEIFAKLSGTSSVSGLLLGPRIATPSDANRKTLGDMLAGKPVSNQRLGRLFLGVVDYLHAETDLYDEMQQKARELVGEQVALLPSEESRHARSLFLWKGLASVLEPAAPKTALALQEMALSSEKMHNIYDERGPSALAKEISSVPEGASCNFFETAAELFSEAKNVQAGQAFFETFGLASLVLGYTHEMVEKNGTAGESLDLLPKLLSSENGQVRPEMSYALALSNALKASGLRQTQAISIAFGPGENKRRDIQRQLVGGRVPPQHVIEAALKPLHRDLPGDEAKRRYVGLILCMVITRAYKRLEKMSNVSDPRLPFQFALESFLARLDAGPRLA